MMTRMMVTRVAAQMAATAGVMGALVMARVTQQLCCGPVLLMAARDLGKFREIRNVEHRNNKGAHSGTPL